MLARMSTVTGVVDVLTDLRVGSSHELMDPPCATAPAARRGTGPVVVTGAAAASAYGRGTEALLSGVLSGRPAFAPVQRFDVSARRVRLRGDHARCT